MKLWILINPPPVSEDTAYLVGRASSRAAEAVISVIAPADETPPAPPDGIDAILNRSFNTRPNFLHRLDALAAKLGIPSINPGAASLRACDKRTYIGDFPAVIPGTWELHTLEDILRLQRELGDEVVLKDPYGKHGKDIIRFRGEADSAEASTLIAKIPEGGVVAQVFCRGFLAGDKRIIVQRGKGGDFEAAAWFGRVPAPGGWKSNVSAGGRIVVCDLEDDERALALAVAEVAALDYVGIDMARENGRCLLIETNAYTGGHINFDVDHRAKSGDDFALMIQRLAAEGRR